MIALSQVSTINGFEHDLRRVCELAHERGALVYADMVHAAGCIPVDVRASGVDFAACASYKWLMGDFGLGFLYVRRDRWPLLRPPHLGYYQLRELRTHTLPWDEPGATVMDYERREDAQGLFAQGTYALGGLALLQHSLDYLWELGVAAVQAHAQSLTNRLKQELLALGYELYTPLEARTPLVTCVLRNARQVLGPRLEAAGVKLTLGPHRFRVSVSVFNGMEDVARLMTALHPVPAH